MKDIYVWIGVFIGVALVKFLLNINSAPTTLVYVDMDDNCIKVETYVAASVTVPGRCDMLPEKYSIVHSATPSESQFNP
mgnify:CR=1 FL=1